MENKDLEETVSVLLELNEAVLKQITQENKSQTERINKVGDTLAASLENKLAEATKKAINKQIKASDSAFEASTKISAAARDFSTRFFITTAAISLLVSLVGCAIGFWVVLSFFPPKIENTLNPQAVAEFLAPYLSDKKKK